MKVISLLLFLLFSISCLASSSTLKIIVVPSAHQLEWSSNKKLIKSFLKSQVHAFRDNNFKDAQRKAIGHIVAKIDCSSRLRWTSISINPSRMVPQLLKFGIDGMFQSNPHAYMQTEEEIKRFVVNNSKNSIVMKFHIDEQTCREMLKMDDVHRSQKRLWFGPLMDTSLLYQSGEHLGGSGSTYAVALKNLDRNNNVDFKQWVEIVELPGRSEKISFYSVQSIWNYAHSEKMLFPSRHYLEAVTHGNRKVRLQGIEF
jgi:hypothetical protein